jgi:hypothetical protein
VLFDLNKDGAFTTADQVTGGLKPVGRNMGGGVRSQLVAFSASGFDVYQSNYDKNGSPPPVVTTSTGSRGVSGGHFDFDVYCYTNCNDTTGKSAGQIYTGQNTNGGANGLLYIHMHEYDDIYDVTGVDMLNPSQSLDKLSRVQINTTTTSTNTSTTGPTDVKGTVTTVSTNKVSGVTSTSSSKPSTSLTTVSSVSTTPTAASGYPKTTTSGSSTTVTTKVSFDTTETYTQNSSISGSSGNYTYSVTTTVKKWTTTRTSTVTTTLVTTTGLVALPTTTGFKILVANQAYSPAAKLSIGGGAYVNAYGYEAAAGLTAASLPTYTLANIGTFRFNLPLDGFKSIDWGTGIVRAGLHPTDYSCAVASATIGPNGEWRNGALTFQVVFDTVTDSDIQLNVTAHPELGYRLKNTSMASKLIAEYTTFWHHPNKLCMADSGWTKSPAQDSSPSSATTATPATGSTDPKDGVFGVSGTNTGASPGTVTTTVTNADGTVTTTVAVTVSNADGTTTTTTTVTTTGVASGIETGGAVSSSGVISTDGTDTRKQSSVVGRINWRELQQ